MNAKMKILKVLGTLSLISPLTGVAQAETTCAITEKWQCAPSQVCQQLENKIVIRIDMNRQIYSRCDAKGCDDFQADFSNSGVFINIALPAKGLLAKLTNDGSSFTEVATLGSIAFISFGSCR
jgi:hypothetical protein